MKLGIVIITSLLYSITVYASTTALRNKFQQLIDADNARQQAVPHPRGQFQPTKSAEERRRFAEGRGAFLRGNVTEPVIQSAKSAEERRRFAEERGAFLRGSVTEPVIQPVKSAEGRRRFAEERGAFLGGGGVPESAIKRRSGGRVVRGADGKFIWGSDEGGFAPTVRSDPVPSYAAQPEPSYVPPVYEAPIPSYSDYGAQATPYQPPAYETPIYEPPAPEYHQPSYTQYEAPIIETTSIPAYAPAPFDAGITAESILSDLKLTGHLLSQGLDWIMDNEQSLDAMSARRAIRRRATNGQIDAVRTIMTTPGMCGLLTSDGVGFFVDCRGQRFTC